MDRARRCRIRQDLGILELLATAGLILPAVLDIAPVMVPVTAVCWILLMLGAMATHARWRATVMPPAWQTSQARISGAESGFGRVQKSSSA
ncbi:DoxX family protein [Nocardia cyriacigeorgica]|uniref:DoxX family protein n=1 Tax=Nocardia cyriacigeorgica TaxID=135487 RepID=UPI00245626A8|nr:DoxX family protein [Nocardia cyriacigeorgica]